jgi:hypothetical protein
MPRHAALQLIFACLMLLTACAAAADDARPFFDGRTLDG